MINIDLTKIEMIPSGGGSGGECKPRYTGHADVEGLKKIGWTDEDIEFYQINGINWNEENDKYHKVPQDNIDLYGVVNVNNINSYRDILVYCPKIDTSQTTHMNYKFEHCYSLVAIPFLDTSKSTSFLRTFNNCCSLVSVPPFDTSNSNQFGSIFDGCTSLETSVDLDLGKGTIINSMFKNCGSLVSVDFPAQTAINQCTQLFWSCSSLVSINNLDLSNVDNLGLTFSGCKSLRYPNLFGLKISIELQDIIVIINKDSLLYIINNSKSTTDITIKLRTNNYAIYSVDPDIIAALANKPFVTLTK